MVLCLCAISYKGDGHFRIQAAENDEQCMQQQTEAAKAAGQQAQVQLTDGWYGIRAILDMPLTRLLQKGSLQLGKHPSLGLVYIAILRQCLGLY